MRVTFLKQQVCNLFATITGKVMNQNIAPTGQQVQPNQPPLIPPEIIKPTDNDKFHDTFYPDPPAHYLESNKMRQTLPIEIVLDFAQTYNSFGMEYDFQKQVEPETVKPLEPSCKQNLKKLSNSITSAMISLMRAFAKPNHTDSEVKQYFKDAEISSNQFFSICKKIRANQINTKLMNKFKKDTAIINRLTHKIEVALKRLDQMYFAQDAFLENSPGKEQEEYSSRMVDQGDS